MSLLFLRARLLGLPLWVLVAVMLPVEDDDDRGDCFFAEGAVSETNHSQLFTFSAAVIYPPVYPLIATRNAMTVPPKVVSSVAGLRYCACKARTIPRRKMDTGWKMRAFAAVCRC